MTISVPHRSINDVTAFSTKMLFCSLFIVSQLFPSLLASTAFPIAFPFPFETDDFDDGADAVVGFVGRL